MSGTPRRNASAISLSNSTASPLSKTPLRGALPAASSDRPAYDQDDLDRTQRRDEFDATAARHHDATGSDGLEPLSDDASYSDADSAEPFEASELLAQEEHATGGGGDGAGGEFDEQEYEDAERYYTALRAQQAQQARGSSAGSAAAAPPTATRDDEDFERTVPRHAAPPAVAASYDPFAAEQNTRDQRRTVSPRHQAGGSSGAKKLRPSQAQRQQR